MGHQRELTVCLAPALLSFIAAFARTSLAFPSKKKEEVGIRVLLPLAGFWLFFRIFADSVSFRSLFLEFCSFMMFYEFYGVLMSFIIFLSFM